MADDCWVTPPSLDCAVCQPAEVGSVWVLGRLMTDGTVKQIEFASYKNMLAYCQRQRLAVVTCFFAPADERPMPFERHRKVHAKAHEKSPEGADTPTGHGLLPRDASLIHLQRSTQMIAQIPDDVQVFRTLRQTVPNDADAPTEYEPPYDGAYDPEDLQWAAETAPDYDGGLEPSMFPDPLEDLYLAWDREALEAEARNSLDAGYPLW